jgi:hypothetical protein
MLLGQDILVAIRLALHLPLPSSQQALADELTLSSVSVVARSLQRLRTSGLLGTEKYSVRAENLHEFLLHGLKYVFPAAPSRDALGVPTGMGALRPDVRAHFVVTEIQVWPHSKGSVRGAEIVPIHPSVPAAALRNPTLHQALALVDLLRIGRARERGIADERLRAMLAS